MEMFGVFMTMAITMFVADTNDDLTKELRESVNAIQSAFDEGDLKTLQGLMTKDHVTTTTYAQFKNTEDQLNILVDYKFTEYDISDFSTKSLTNDAALVSYRAAIRGTYRGEAVPSAVLVHEVWIKRDGKWLQATYQETSLD